MEGVNDKYNIALEVLTPLAICAGSEKDWISGFDFVIEGRTLYKINLQKLIDEGADATKISACFINKNTQSFHDLIGNRLDRVSDLEFSLPSAMVSENLFTSPVKTFIKNQILGNPIVPGSSIKGAFHSIISPEKKFTRFIKVSDIEFENTQLVNTKIFNLRNVNGIWEGGWKKGASNTEERFSNNGFNTIYEMIVPGSRGFGTIMLSERQLVLSNEEINPIFKSVLRQSNGMPISLFHRINEHTLNHLKKELAFFKKYKADRSDEIETIIEELIQYVEEIQYEGDKQCIFRMSAGSGFHSITGDKLADYSINGVSEKGKKNRGQLNGEDSSKSRKIAIYEDNLFPMGFVKMSIASEDDVRQCEQIRMERALNSQKEYEKIKADKEKLRIEQEELLRFEQERKRRQVEYNELIDKAEELYISGDKEKALELYMKAADIWSDGFRHKDRIDELKLFFENQQREKEIKEHEAQARQKSVDAGLSTLDRKHASDPNVFLVTKFQQVTNDIENWCKKSKSNYVREPDDEYIVRTLIRIAASDNKELTNIKNFDSKYWKIVRSRCGERRAKVIYDRVLKG